MVLVKMSGLGFAEPSYRPLWVHGVLKISARKSPDGQVAYQMEGDHLEMYREQ
jgi:hypothetical protein